LEGFNHTLRAGGPRRWKSRKEEQSLKTSEAISVGEISALLEFRHKIYDVMASLNMTFQQNTSTVETTLTEIKTTTETLEKLSRNSKLTKLLTKGMSEDLIKYQDVFLQTFPSSWL
jgi:2-succinyl-5-enolpyruvyl-6-hydroxy-3-cyclohexene-1-carboxylate synthase